MSGRSQVIRLSNRAQVAVEEYGDARGVPVVFCHGWPSSRTMAELTHDAACELGVRIISPDRPGIRDSAFHPNRTLLDWPPLIREVAEQLELETFRMLGISGGAPYAFVTAWAMPERVQAIAVVNGVPPIADLSDRTGLMPLHNRLLALRQRTPRLLRLMFHLVRPIAATRMPMLLQRWLMRTWHGYDANMERDTAAFDSCFESARQAWRASVGGIMADAEIFATPWGFPLEDIRVPVRLWHGMHDRTFHYSLAEQLATNLPNCTVRIVENAGHFSLPIRQIREILADLIATPAR
ncbi:MAG: alpha/beta fold hydrolase [Chthoniobacterales bacterium]